MTLDQLTALMGDALKAIEAKGIEIDERSTRIWADHVIDAFKKLPPDPVRKKAKTLLDALQDEEANHGSLRIPASKRAEGALRAALNS